MSCIIIFYVGRDGGLLQCCNLKVFVRKTEGMIYPEAAQLKLQFEFWILCRSLAVLCREYYFLNIKTCRPAPRQGNEIFFRDSQLNCCFGISTESCARISGQGQPICWCLPSHHSTPPPPSHLLTNLIIFPRASSRSEGTGRPGWKTADQFSQ